MALDINNNNKALNNSPDSADTNNSAKKIRENESPPSSSYVNNNNNNNNNSHELSITNLDKKMQENSIDIQHQEDEDNKAGVNGSTATATTTSSSSLLSSMVQSVHNQEAIEALLKRTGYPLRQENGQRKYGPPPNWDPAVPEPDRGCEIFIGKIPRDCFEDEIVPLLERVGHLYEFRLMMEYSGYNRGYGFAMFTSRDDAKKAVVELNNYEIRKGRMIGICRSVDNCRLFVGGIPKSKTKEEILEEMRKVTDDVVNVIVYPSAHDKSKNRGFAFVQYTNHRAAAIARRKLIPNRIQLFGQPIAVDWAEPEPEVDEDVMATVKVLYVRNLMLSTTEEQIKAEFEKIKEGMIERVKKMKDFAFVHFKEREDALRCMRIMNGATIDGALVEVSLSKPIDKTALLRLSRATPSPTSHLLTNAAAIMAAVNAANPNVAPPVITIPFQTVLSDSAAVVMAPPQNGGANTPPNPLAAMQPPPPPPPSQQQYASYQAQQSLLTTVAASAASPTSSSYPLAAQFIAPPMSYQAADLIAQQTPQSQQNPLLMNSKVHRSSRAVSNSRSTAGMYRYYVKSVAGTVKKQASSQDIPYDLYSGMNPVPVLPFSPFINYPNKTSTQILDEICIKEGFGMPTYALHTTNGTDQDGREIGLYMYKITIPGLFQGKPVSSNKLMRTIEEAKIDAADFVLSQIYPPPQATYIDANEYYAAVVANSQQQQQQQQQLTPPTTTPATTSTTTATNLPPPQANTQIAPGLVYHTADLVNQRNAIQSAIQSAIIQQQSGQQQPATTGGNPADMSGLYQGQVASMSMPANANAAAAAASLLQTQYLVDSTGQYIVCQPSLWQ